MCVQKFKAAIFLSVQLCLIVLVCLCGCEPMDTILPSTGPYKVNVSMNGATLDELSFFDSSVKIKPYFEESVLNDPDVTALVVFLRNSRGNTVGWKVTYTLEPKVNEETETAKNDDALKNSNDLEDTEEDLEEDKLSSEDEDEDDLSPVVIVNNRIPPASNTDSYKDGDDLIITVRNLDGELPVFPLPDDLPVGRYTLVSQVMSGRSILQRIEKSIYYMGKTVFSFDGIQVYLPGVTESSQVIPKGMVVLLETALNFNSRLNPYIIWYNGRRKIGEGYFSDGAGYLLWKAPEQSGFYSLHAEVFPVNNFEGLSGYQKEISLLVSSKDINVNLVSENTTELLHWYTFEGNLNDSKLISSIEYALKPDAKNVPKWAGANGTYGLVTGPLDIFSLPKVLVLNNGTDTWQILFRFKSLNDGVILGVQFGNSRDVFLNLKVEDHNLVLELVSSVETVSQIFPLPQQSISAGQNSFIKAGIVFSILPEMLAANINIVDSYSDNSEFNEEWACLDAQIEGEFQIMLGHKSENDGKPQAAIKSDYTAIWDEFALYFMPPAEIPGADEKEAADEEQPQDEESLAD